ncbi:MAG: hypothetical protein NTV08_07020 [Verrucomicrobia bacterium]|nr:hypothetical protein [Verrucomicrobiota bacterium]
MQLPLAVALSLVTTTAFLRKKNPRRNPQHRHSHACRKAWN